MRLGTTRWIGWLAVGLGPAMALAEGVPESAAPWQPRACVEGGIGTSPERPPEPTEPPAGRARAEANGSEGLPGPEARDDGRVAINRADVEGLMRLPGVGPRKARALLEARERRPFRRPSDLRRVKGFGPKTILRLAPLLSFE